MQKIDFVDTKKTKNCFYDSFMVHFKSLKDPRIDMKKLHNLMEILFIAVSAFLCGANSWLGVVEFANIKEKWLKKFIKLENGIPSHVTFWRVFSSLKAEEFEKCFILWMEKLAKIYQKEVIAIDGKTLRGTYDIENPKDCLHIVSAFATENKLVLGQIKTNEKSNEITAIPKLLEMVDIKNSIVTIDAMGCQKEIANTIINEKGDYILALKGNQKGLKEDVELFLRDGIETNFKGIKYDYFLSQEKSHGRIETRKAYVVQDIDWLSQKKDWKSLNSIVAVEAIRERKNKKTKEIRYYISSLKISAKKILEGIRNHWGIENSFHWCLDVGFREDRIVAKNKTAAENMAILRRIAFNLLKKDKSSKRSIENKRLKAALDESYLENLLGVSK